VNANAEKEDMRNEERQKKTYLRVSFRMSARYSGRLFKYLVSYVFAGRRYPPAIIIS